MAVAPSSGLDAATAHKLEVPAHQAEMSAEKKQAGLAGLPHQGVMMEQMAVPMHDADALTQTLATRFTRSLYDYVPGGASPTDPRRVFLLRVFQHHVVFAGYSVVLALAVVPVAWLHSVVAFRYLDEWERIEVAAANATHTGVSAVGTVGLGAASISYLRNNLGPPAMWDPQAPFFWVWTSAYSVSALTSIYSTLWLWPGVIARWHLSGPLKAALMLWTVLFPAYTLLTYWRSWASDAPMTQTLFVGPTLVVAVITMVIIGHHGWSSGLARYLRFPSFGWYVGMQSFFQAIIYFVYLAWVPRWFFSVEGVLPKLAIRLILHPLLFELSHGVNRVAILMYPAHLSEKRLHSFTVPTYVVANLLGRFLVASIPDLWGTVLISVLLGVQETLMRVTTALRDYVYLRLTRGAKVADAHAFTQASRHIKGDILNVDIIAEFTSIMVAPAIVFMFRVQQEDGTTMDGVTLVLSCLIQLGIEIVVDMAPALIVYVMHSHVNVGELATAPSALVQQVDSDDEDVGDELGWDVSRKVVAPAAASARYHDDGGERGSEGAGRRPFHALDVTRRRVADVEASQRRLQLPGTNGSATGGKAWAARAQVGPLTEARRVRSGTEASSTAASSRAADADSRATDGSCSDIGEGDCAAPAASAGAHLDTIPSSGGESLGAQPDSICAVLRRVQLITSIKSAQATAVNCWDVRYKYFGLVMVFYFVGWTAYFLRSFFYPGSVFCGFRHPVDGAWVFGPCLKPPAV